jgi:hypothetical protein
MDGEPFELSVIGFANRSKGNHGRGELLSCRSGFEMAVFTQFIPRIFQRSLN